MSVTYEPISIDFDKNRIHFLLRYGNSTLTTYITFNKRSELLLYEGVNKECHFRDIKGDIVVIQNCPTRLVTVINGETFIKARQWEYDRWMNKKYPYTINASVYDILSKRNFISSTI